jgi:thiamine biosynthesis lipoprotein
MTTASTGASHHLETINFPALGTTATVLVTGAGPSIVDLVGQAVEAEVAAMDQAASRFRADSELTRINRAAGGPVAVSPLLIEAVEVALRAARLTGGMVDPTIGKALRLLGYDRDFARLDRMGGPVELQAEAVPGWQLLTVDRRTGIVRIPAGVELDLGATAKALAADRAAAAAIEAAAHRGDSAEPVGVLVSLGGDVATAGPPPPGGWSIRVTDDHAGPVDATGQTITINGGALATSGTTVRRWQRGAVVCHHLIDPATGQPAAACWQTVSVAAATCVDANTASTAAVILGKRAVGWLAERNLPARLVDEHGKVTTTAGWPAPTSPAGWPAPIWPTP